MGVWWKDVEYAVPNVGTVSFDGDPAAVPKAVWGAWRLGQHRSVLRAGKSSGASFINGYYVFFDSPTQRMVFRKPLVNEYIAVRVGTEEVCFWIVSAVTGEILPLTNTEVIIPAPLLRNAPPSKHDPNVWVAIEAGRVALI